MLFLPEKRTLEKQTHLTEYRLSHQRILFESPRADIVQRIFRTGGCRLARQFKSQTVSFFDQLQHVICKYMFKQQVKGLPVIMMTQMTKFVEENIVTKDTRETHQIEVEIDVVLC